MVVELLKCLRLPGRMVNIADSVDCSGSVACELTWAWLSAESARARCSVFSGGRDGRSTSGGISCSLRSSCMRGAQGRTGVDKLPKEL